MPILPRVGFVTVISGCVTNQRIQISAYRVMGPALFLLCKFYDFYPVLGEINFLKFNPKRLSG